MRPSEKYQIKEDKLKPLAPTLRTKKRFIKVKVQSNCMFKFKDLSGYLSDEILFYIGAIDYSKAGIWFLKDKFNEKEQELVIKCATKYKDKALASLALIEKINGKDAKVSIIKVSGTLKGLEK